MRLSLLAAVLVACSSPSSQSARAARADTAAILRAAVPVDKYLREMWRPWGVRIVADTAWVRGELLEDPKPPQRVRSVRGVRLERRDGRWATAFESDTTVVAPPKP